MDHGAFLQAIRDEPDDDAHRLAYADWLEGHAGPRGADRLFAAAPLRGLHVRRLSGSHVPAFAACQHLARVEALDLEGVRQAVHDALASPHLTRLTELGLAGSGVEWPTSQALAQSG